MFPAVQHRASIRPAQVLVHGFNFSEMQPQPALVRDQAQDLEFSALLLCIEMFSCLVHEQGLNDDKCQGEQKEPATGDRLCFGCVHG